MQPRHLTLDLAFLSLRSNTLPPATHTNVVALGSSDLLIVDPAPCRLDEQREMLQWLQALKSQNCEVKAALLSHHHHDHIGAAALLANTLKIPLWAHERTARQLPHLSFARLIVDNDTITLGDHRWRALHTPGHAQGHICLYNDLSRTLVMGDMLASNGSVLIPPNDGDMSEYLRQLQRLEKLNACIGLPAHGEPIDSPSHALKELRTHRLHREARILDALRFSSPASLEELLDRAYNDIPVLRWPLAQLSLKAHLIKLEREGHAKMLSNNLYRATRQ